MPEDTLMVFTYRSLKSILEDGGAQAWVLDPERAQQCTYIVCTRNRHFRDPDPVKQNGAVERHGTAFLIGRITTVGRAPDDCKRYIVRFDEYATPAPEAFPLAKWPGTQNPVRYVKDIAKLGIDPDTLDWQAVKSRA